MPPDTFLVVRPARPEDLAAVSEVLVEAARWLEAEGKPLWNPAFLTLDKIAPGLPEFFVAEREGAIVGVMKFQLEDPVFWPESAAGEACYVHRLAVRRSFAGGAVSGVLLDFAAARTRKLGRMWLRLDCAADRPGLRAIYERRGFVYHSDHQAGSLRVARYQLRVGA